MRNLTTTEIANTNGGFGLCDVMGNCPYATTVGWALFGMVAGASYAHGYLRNNAKLLQWTLGSGAAAAAISLGLDYAKGSSSTTAA